ncbi:oligosaccharide flippase family protein [Chryseobacterium paridis]|uniref:Oligosaccharide flippase family protein n=1 Tax=Chryseobacterium paridis TaxID=2800328 RepID=A0ABS1FZR1_9FLAO|nr:oligosaccharide flippase family protein [Chryseobacterium paridis]MBK1897708.1 oligosaccharide flippase family protein [Chryseobacterium paridis]
MESNFLRILSNYGAKILNIFSVFIFIPIYIKFLGIENFSVISFYTLILGIVSFADSGISSAVIKEFSLDNTPNYKYTLFRNVERLYILICIALLTILILSSKLIAVNWLNTKTIPVDDLAYYIRLISLGVTLQLFSSVYFGALFGLGNQIITNTFQIVWNLAKSGLVILMFIFYKNTLEVYFVWQIVVNIIYLILLRYILIVKLKKKSNEKLFITERKIPKHVLSYISGMSLIAIISAFNIQIDKIVVSSYFTLDMLGYYSISSILSQTPVMACTPLVFFIFPVFSKLSFDQNHNFLKLRIVFKKITYFLLILSIPILITILLYAKELLLLWIGHKTITSNLDDIVVVTRLLITGSFFMVLQLPLFYFLLSKNKTRYMMMQGIAQIIIEVPILILCIKYFGIKGVGVPWIIINVFALIYLMYIVFNKYLPKDIFIFSLRSFFKILSLAIIAFVPLYYSYIYNNYYFIYNILISSFVFVLGICYLDKKFLRSKNKKDIFRKIFEFPN